MNDRPIMELKTAGASFALDPRPQYADLRARCPVAWQPGANAWLVTRYEDVFGILRDPSLGHVGILRPWHRLQERHGWHFPTVIKVISGMPFNYEGKPHADLRRSVARAIAPFADQHGRFAARAERLLKAARRNGGFDFAEDFANRLLVSVLCDLAEVPEAFLDVLYPLSRLSWTIEATISIRERQEMERIVRAAYDLMIDEIPGIIERSPGSLLASIHRSLPDGESDPIAATMVFFSVMLMMGNDALGGALGSGVRWLIDEGLNGGASVSQGDWARVSDDILRHAATVDFLTREAREEMRVSGVSIAPGEWIMTSPFAANRDSTRFGPDADRISLDHDFGPGLTFGTGRHLCVGMQISRNIATAGLAGLGALPPLRTIGPVKPARGRIIRTFDTMPVALG